jgi:hypothetical protein
MIFLPENFAYLGGNLCRTAAADAWKIAEPLHGPTLTKYTELAKEFDVWLSLGGFQEKAEEAKKMHS